jgi:hypothetical protein
MLAYNTFKNAYSSDNLKAFNTARVILDRSQVAYHDAKHSQGFCDLAFDFPTPRIDPDLKAYNRFLDAKNASEKYVDIIRLQACCRGINGQNPVPSSDL